MTAPDYSHYLSPDMLARTEIEWGRMDRTELCALIMDFEPKTVIEFCCGTGWIPKGLPGDVDYVGIDANRGCISLAVEKNSGRVFHQADIRESVKTEGHDMALGFSCLKHFSLAEWDDIYGKMLRAGNRTITSIYMTPEDREDEHHGFPHTSVSMGRVERVCAENGHRVVKVMTLPPLNTQPEPLVLTERIPVDEPEAEEETPTEVYEEPILGEEPGDVLEKFADESPEDEVDDDNDE